MKGLKVITSIPSKYKSLIRDKAINRARTRIIVAGGDPATFSEEDLEIVVREEEDNINSAIKQRGLLAVLALFGVHILG